MIFGVDLGTTNSLIGVDGDLLTSLVSSNVDVKKKTQVERGVVSEDIVASYKTNMSKSRTGKLAIYCSSIILKKLAEMGSRRYGELVKEIVISVPAYFSSTQREAVYEAGELAGLQVKALINEPTAAALYICREQKDLIVVYDLGGGTFDVSIVDSRMGDYAVIAKDGTEIGGDNLDLALVEDVLESCRVPIRLRSKMTIENLKRTLQLAKEELQQKKADCMIDLSDVGLEGSYTLEVEKYKNIVHQVFEKTINMTNALISREVPLSEKPKIIYIGGSVYCPYLRKLLNQEIGLEEIVHNEKPDLLVAKGVSIYAKMLHDGTENEFVQDVTTRLCIEDEEGRGITIIDDNTILPCSNSVVVWNAKKGKTLSLDLYQGNFILAKENAYIGRLVYEYDSIMERGEGDVEVSIEISRNGIVTLCAWEPIYGKEYAQEIRLEIK